MVTTERVRAELLAHAPEGVAAGKPVWLGLQLTHPPEWHTYWKNAGDSGLPTQLEWTLPPGVLAGDIEWPVPVKIPIGTLANYGYEGTVLLPVPLTIAPDFKPSLLAQDLDVRLKASWLVCRKECIPEDGEFAIKLPIRGSTALHAQAFEAAFAAQPKPVLTVPGKIIPDSTAQIVDDALEVRVQGLPASVRGKQLEFFPETPEVIQTAGAWTQAWNGAVWTANVPLSPQRSASPGVMPVVLADGPAGWRAELRWGAPGRRRRLPAAVSPALEEALRNNAAGTPAAPKSGAARRPAGRAARRPDPQPDALRLPGAGDEGRRLRRRTRHDARRDAAPTAWPSGRRAGLLPGAGAACCWRCAPRGEQLGWGFQLQSPVVVALLVAALLAGRRSTCPACSRSARFAAGGRRPRSQRGIRCAAPSSPACWRSWSPRPAPRRSWAPRWASR